MSTERDIWYFWNRSFLAREYPRRKIRKKYEKGELRRYICIKCKNRYIGQRFLFGQREGRLKYLCPRCHDEEKEIGLLEARDEQERDAIRNATKFKELLNDCTKLGTCDILAAHHELLKDDDNRLRTDFIMEEINKMMKSKLRNMLR